MSITLINPFFLRPVKLRTFFSSGYQAGRITTTSSANQAAAFASTIEDPGDYVAFWQATGDNSATTSDFRAELTETSQRQAQNIEPQDATDALSIGGMYGYSGGTNKTFTLNYNSEAATAGIAGRAVNVLKLESGDSFQHQAGTVSTTSTTALTRCSVSIPSAGEWIIIGSASLLGGNGYAQIAVDGVGSRGVGRSMGQDATTWSPFFMVWKVTTTGADTARLTYYSTGSSMSIKQATLVVLDASKFENVYYGDDAGEGFKTTTSNTFVSAFSQTFNLVNPGNYHLLLASNKVASSATNSSVGTKLINTSRNINYNVTHFRENNTTLEQYSTVVARITSFVDPSPTIEWQHYSEGSNTSSTAINSICLLDLGEPAPPIYFIGSNSVVNSTSVTITDQAEEGDIVIVVSHSTSTAVSTPTGFTSIANGTQNTVNYQAAYKIMGAVPDSTADGLTSGADVKHIALAFRYVDPPISIITGGFNPQINTGTSGMPVLPSQNLRSSPAGILMVLVGFLDDDNVASSVTAPEGYSLCGVEQATGTLMTAYRVFTSPRPTTETPGTFGGDGTDTWVSMTIPLEFF